MNKALLNPENQSMISQDLHKKLPMVLLLSIGMIFALLWYGKFHVLPLMQPDSSSYIEFSPVRTVGYPFFLWIVKIVFGTLKVIPVLQLSILVLSATYLALEFYKLTRRYLLALLLMAGLMINPIYEHAFNILTESLSISLLMIFLGTAIRLCHRPTFKKMAILSVVAGLSILIRPVHFAYVPVLIGFGFWAKSTAQFRIFQSMSVLLAPLILILFLGCGGQYAKNGIFRLESMGAMNMVGKVCLIADKNIEGRYPQFLNEVADFAAPIQEYLDQTPNLQIRYLLSVPYYDYFRYRYLSEISQRVYAHDTIYSITTWDIIKARFSAYAMDVWMNFSALWQLYDLLTMGEKKILKSFLDAHPSPPFTPYPWYPDTDHVSLKHNPILVWGVRLSLLAIALSGLAMILGVCVLLLKRRSVPTLIFVGATAALVTQGHFLLTALVQAGLPRYSFGLWPAIVLVGIIVMELGRQKWKGHIS